MPLPTRIPATVVTGFLGAGKTSLVRHLAETSGRRLALIVNEFGELGIDGEALKACGLPDCTDDDVIELANGCICCTVADDFLPTMLKLLDRPNPPEHIIIETSGLALPKPLVKAFTWPEIRSRVTVDGVIAVVDAAAAADGRFADDPDAVDAQRAADPSLDHESPLAELYEDQLAAADLVVLNKRDLVDADGLARVRADAEHHIGRPLRFVEAERGTVPASVALGIAAAVEDAIEGRPSHHDGEDDHEHDDFESFVVDIAPAASPDDVLTRVRTVLGEPGVLRVKGFAAVSGKPMRLQVQAVGSRAEAHFDRPWGTRPPAGRLVVIGLAGLDRGRIAGQLAG